MDGFNNCLFAYGQTGSGKTHSVLGASTLGLGGTTVVRDLQRPGQTAKAPTINPKIEGSFRHWP